jgi:hypothetical protein
MSRNFGQSILTGSTWSNNLHLMIRRMVPSRGTFGYSAFTYDAEKNCYICPAGKLLKTAWRSKKKDPYRYRTSQNDCRTCPLKPQCCPNMLNRKIVRNPHEPARDLARKIAKTDSFKRSFRQLKKIEMLFAHLKRILRLDKLDLGDLDSQTFQERPFTT